MITNNVRFVEMVGDRGARGRALSHLIATDVISNLSETTLVSANDRLRFRFRDCDWDFYQWRPCMCVTVQTGERPEILPGSSRFDRLVPNR